ncbi:MAG: hypothetical protein V3V33_00600 [Candidatus Lokiarchaeia archaeon]
MISIEEKVKNKFFEIIKKLYESVKIFKDKGFSAEETRNYINKCYIINELKKSGIEFSSKGELEKVLSYINNERDNEISKSFYEKFRSDEYFAPNIDKIHVDTQYKSKNIGNVIETEFEDVSKVSEKNIETDYTDDNELCDLHQEFTADGKLISTCKKVKKEEGLKNAPR